MNRTLAAIAAGAVAAVTLATPAAANADVVGTATCLYGGPSWMSTWTVTTDYPFSVYGPGLERTHQYDELTATLEVVVNVGTAVEPDYVTVVTTIDRPAGCDGVVVADPPTVVDDDEDDERECRDDRHDRRDRRGEHGRRGWRGQR